MTEQFPSSNGKSTKFSSFSIDSLLSKNVKDIDHASVTSVPVSNVEFYSQADMKNTFEKYFCAPLQECCSSLVKDNSSVKETNKMEDFDNEVVSTSNDFYHSSRSREEGETNTCKIVTNYDQQSVKLKKIFKYFNLSIFVFVKYMNVKYNIRMDVES
ncbi:hypothetical protein HHI36_001095 [Cryptolaemus montrouzieri]|uniref:Uncharacterized protein n=1 Tax=Cryptolaemus montrouzieri TaxID=559131 RepID=A0ABD2P6D3_9CUCU